MVEYSAKTAYRDEKVATEYDKVRFRAPQGKLTDDIERRAVRRFMAQFAQGSLVLDLASGLGRFASLASESGHSVVASDISAEMLTKANSRLAKRSGFKGAVLCEAERLPFRDNAFDAVIVIRFVGMLPGTARSEILKEIRRVTRRWVILNLPNSVSAMWPLTAVWRLTGRPREYYPASPWAWRRELEDAGLKIAAWCGPLVIPTRRLPGIFLGLARVVNRIGERSLLGYLSEQHFSLLEKTPSP